MEPISAGPMLARFEGTAVSEADSEDDMALYRDRGFTVLEVLVAIIVLGVGVVALVGSSGLVTRMIGQGKRATRGVQVAERRMETLRQQAASTVPACGALASGTAPQPGGIVEVWTVVTTPRVATLRVIVTYPDGRRTAADTLLTALACV